MNKHIRKRSSSSNGFLAGAASSQESDRSRPRTARNRPASAPNFVQPTKKGNGESSSLDQSKRPMPLGPLPLTAKDDSNTLKRCTGEFSSVELNQAKLRRLETFKYALERVQELQQSIEDDECSLSSDTEYDLQDHLESIIGPSIAALAPRIDPETLGFLACAQETMKYLSEHGMPRDHPVVVNLRKRLIEGIARK